MCIGTNEERPWEIKSGFALIATPDKNLHVIRRHYQ